MALVAEIEMCVLVPVGMLGQNLKKKLRGLSPQATYTDRVAAAGRRS